jgi:hypothetical protein
VPLRSSDRNTGIVDKVMDQGPLALREPWGSYRRSIRTPDGVRVPAEWSREGSGIIGPVPSATGAVRMTIWAASGRDRVQPMRVQPPWPADPVAFGVPAAFTNIELILHRSDDAPLQPTGVYRLSSPTPYDPAGEGIKGFASDLGVLVHRIRIEPAD